MEATMSETTDPYAAKPWLSLYDAGQPETVDVPWRSMLEVVEYNAEHFPDTELIKYFDGTITYREFDEITDALACGLLARGFVAGDRLAIMTQNNPQFLIAMAGAWKAGGVAVSVNPMNRERELTYIAADSGARAIVCLESIYRDVVAKMIDDSPIEIALSTSELAYQSRDDERVFAGVTHETPDGATDLEALIAEYRGQQPPPVTFGPDDVAVITYTSGTTGEPKGATNTHGNVLHNSLTYLRWMELANDTIFGIAPLFHITGMIGHATVAMYGPVTLALAHRFEPFATADAIEEHQCTFTIGAITVYIAMMNATGLDAKKLSSLTKVHSGGAAIPPSVVERFRAFSGQYIHNAYGLTETTSPSHLVPMGAEAPVDETSGAISVGVPIYGTIVRIVNEDGDPLPVGEIGELESDGPGIVPAYWNKPEATAKDIPGGRLRTGDVGFMNADGCFFIVDRKKDMINASGYKVWPREVEDVLYTHPAVREAAVVGIADEYRGETVKAVVSLQQGESVSPEELTAYCKERMAAYKYPRIVEIVDELPKTVSGKILRRELRD